MALAMSAQLSAQLRSDKEAFYRLRARLENLRQERAHADEALSCAQQRVTVLATQQSQIESLMRSFSESIHISRSLILQEFHSTCPEDVLRCIFEAAVDLPDDKWTSFGYGSYNAERSALPFTLAAVCSRWRRVAFSCPRLWTYISLPGPDDITKFDAHLERVNVLLTRSFPFPLDILLQFTWEDYVYKFVGDADPLQRCLDALSRHSGRWQTVEMWLPWGRPSQLDIFRSPLPLITRLYVSGDSNLSTNGDDGLADYLPFAPNLKELGLSAGMIISHLGHPGFPSLLSLKIWNTPTTDFVVQVLTLCQATLQHLELASSQSRHSPLDLSDHTFAFPYLRSLSLRNPLLVSAWLPDALPSLTTLVLDANAVVPTLLPLLSLAAPTVTHIKLCGDLEADLVKDLQLLVNITHLTLTKFIPFDDQCLISDALFGNLADAVPDIWPKLTCVTIGPEAEFIPWGAGGGGILRLIKKRNLLPHPAGHESPNRLERVDFLEPPPTWLAAEVSRLLSL